MKNTHAAAVRVLEYATIAVLLYYCKYWMPEKLGLSGVQSFVLLVQLSLIHI